MWRPRQQNSDHAEGLIHSGAFCRRHKDCAEKWEAVSRDPHGGLLKREGQSLRPGLFILLQGLLGNHRRLKCIPRETMRDYAACSKLCLLPSS